MSLQRMVLEKPREVVFSMQQAAPSEAHVFAGVFAFMHITDRSDERDQGIGEIKCTTELFKSALKINPVFLERKKKATKLF